MAARIVDFGFIAGLLILAVVLLFAGVSTLMGWSFIHDKLRFERKQDEKENLS
jgi:hypothetical protein